MNRKAGIIILVTLLFCSTSLLGQTRFSKHNQIILDSAKQYISQSCGYYKSSKETSIKTISADKSIITFLNEFYNKDLTSKNIFSKLDKFFKGKWSFDTTNLGAFYKYDRGMYSQGNLRAYISFATFENEIVYKRIYFQTRTNIECPSMDNIPVSSQDLLYLEKECISIVDFPFTFCNNCTFITCDTIFNDKLKLLSATSPYFFPDQSDRELSIMTWFSNDIYKVDYVVNDISRLVKNREYELLRKLLYSPNYILSVYAMEALLYLEESKEVENSEMTHAKMEEIKNSDTKIKFQYSDVIKMGARYKDLEISRQKIVSKFGKP